MAAPIRSQPAATTRRVTRGGAARPRAAAARAGRVSRLLRVVAFIALFPIVWLLLGSIQTVQELYRRRDAPGRPCPSSRTTTSPGRKGGFSVYLPNSLFYSTVTVRGDPARRQHGRLRAGADRVPRPRRRDVPDHGDHHRAAAGHVHRALQAAGRRRAGEHPDGLHPGAGGRRPADLDLHPARLLHAPAEGAGGRGDPGRLLGVRRLLAGDAAAGPARAWQPSPSSSSCGSGTSTCWRW